MSKAALVAGTFQPTTVVSFAGLPLAEGQAYSLQPATTPPGGAFETINDGTEYFMSALQFGGISAQANVRQSNCSLGSDQHELARHCDTKSAVNQCGG